MLKISMIFNNCFVFLPVERLLLLLHSRGLSRGDVVAVPGVAETDVQDSHAAAVGSLAGFLCTCSRALLLWARSLVSSVPARE